MGLQNNNRFALAADFNHDGVVDYVSSTYGDFRAWRGSDGAQLWQFDKSITTHADISGCGTYINSEQFALGDVTGGGDIYLFASVNCDTLATAGEADRYFAANASQILAGGKVATQWVSPRLSQPHPDAYATNASPTLPNPPVTPTYAASASGSVPALAKLTAGGSTKLLTRFLANSTYGYYYDRPNSGHLAYAACRTITGLPGDEGRACKATFVIDAATGAIDQVLTAPNPADEYVAPRNSPTEQNIPIIADLDGDGQVEIISGGDVWKLVGGVWTLAWQAQFDAYTGPKKSFEPSSVAVADLDGDGKAEVIFHLLANYYQAGGVYIFNHDGSLRRKIPISTNVSAVPGSVDYSAAPPRPSSGSPLRTRRRGPARARGSAPGPGAGAPAARALAQPPAGLDQARARDTWTGRARSRGKRCGAASASSSNPTRTQPRAPILRRRFRSAPCSRTTPSW